MIDVTRLYCGAGSEPDRLRYGRGTDAGGVRRPVVVWTATLACNLRCVHCYSASTTSAPPDELTGEEAAAMIDDLAAFGVPVLLVSGGEPTVRGDVYDLCGAAAERGMRVAISSNGTLIGAEEARRIAGAGVSYVGVSIDGPRGLHDELRGSTGAFDRAVEGLAHLRAAGVRTGLRVTVLKDNASSVPFFFELARSVGAERLCFYHLVYSGRAALIVDRDPGPAETRAVIDRILDCARSDASLAEPLQVLTVDNPADGAYIYMRLAREDPARAAEVLAALRRHGGGAAGSGVGLASIDSRGFVHPDQFWQGHRLGSVRERPFGEIWSDESNGLLAGLRDRLPRLRGRCSGCAFLDVCGGGFRARAEALTGDMWAPDPACYLSDDEIAAGAFAPGKEA